MRLGRKYLGNLMQYQVQFLGLKAKYEGIKKSLKKKVIKNKEESMKTGGGIPKFEPIEGPERDLLAVLNTQVGGMPSSNDSDFGLSNTDLAGILNQKEDESVLENPNEQMVADEMECLEAARELLNSPNQLNENIILEVVDDGETNAEKYTEKTLSDANWSKWTPGLLKTKKRKMVNSNMKRKPSRKQDVGENVNDLMAERQSLVHLQKELLLKEEERKEREHAAAMEKIHQEKMLNSRNDERLEKEHLLRMRLLELEIFEKQK